ncbi:tyrosinase family protein, partial [Marinobacter sp.]|uniref:tyrosinase family protein n=1 Tax=Marinobacter sp. TaxID=50741 RepID=UPI003299A828
MSDRVALEQENLAGLRYRPSVRELEKDSDKLGRFVNAWKAILAKPKEDESSFHHIAGIHGLPAPISCLHNIHFFPWHRAYLLKLERALNKVDSSVAMPWWDFATALSRKEGLPKSFQSVANGGKAVLASTNIVFDGDRETERMPGTPSDLPRKSLVDEAMRQNNFRSFHDSYYSPIHNAIHGWLGGDALSTNWTAFDPAFWIFHCAHDRHWWLWQISPQGKDPPI